MLEPRTSNAGHEQSSDPLPQSRLSSSAAAVEEHTSITRAQHERMANAIRALAMDAVEQRNPDIPGFPWGPRNVATVLFTQFLKFDPSDPRGRIATVSCCPPAMARC